jgi:hypothetical protein
MPFVKGESGNPAGRPPGSRNTKTLLREAMLDAEGDDLTRQLVAMAKEGDRTALRLCIERVLPRGTSRPIEFELPRVDTAAAARQAVADIVVAMGKGQLAPREGDEMMRVIERGAKIIATAEKAEAAAREGQPRHVQVTWVDPKEKKEKWKSYWKRRYRESYEAAYGPLPDLPDPEEDGMLPPETAPAEAAPAAAGGKAGAPSDREPPLPPSPGGGADAGNNENNENNGNNGNTGAPAEPKPAARPSRYRGPRHKRTAWTVRVADDGLPGAEGLVPVILRAWRRLAARLRAGDWPAIGAAPVSA